MKKTALQIKLSFLGVFMAFALLLMVSPVVGQNLVQNGGFEDTGIRTWAPNHINAYKTLSATVLLPKWTHVGGVIDVHNRIHLGMGCPGNDSQHVDLNTNGVISQNVSGLKVGLNYTLTFYTSVHTNLNSHYNDCTPWGNADATALIVNNPSGTQVLTAHVTEPPTNVGVWTMRTYGFMATDSNITITFRGDSSCYSQGGVLIDSVVIWSVCNPDCQDTTTACNPDCQDDDWYEVGTTDAPMSNTVHAYRIGNAGIGTNNPVWNFKLTVDNRDDIYQQNNNRNAIIATAMHTECSFGYGILVNTNPLAGTKALAVQGNGVDRAVIFGNGKSWFGNVMTLGGNPPADACQDLPSTHILTINGTGLINSMNITSDSRFKDNIEPIENTDEIIKKLNPVTYQYKTTEFADRNFPEGSTYGFIAQELKEVLPYTVTEEKDGFYSVNYIALIPVLTKAIKDQQAEIETLKAKVEAIAEANKIQGSLEGGIPTQKVDINKAAMLMQNSPNPLNDVTFIDFYLPASATSAFIKVTDNNGRLIQAFPINKTGYGQLELNCANMVSGTYYYSLIIDNNIIDTKTMLIAKN